MNIEKDIVNLFASFLKERSIFKDVMVITKKAPLNFVQFPTIVIKETNNSDFIRGMSVNLTEAVARLTYQVDIYTKDIVLEVKEETEMVFL